MYVGVDIFGFWEVIVRKIRGGVVNVKRWVILFICLMSRVVYIELVDEMIFSVFINFFRCFVVMCGKVIEFYLDRGINFVGSIDVFNINVINIEFLILKKYMVENGFIWIFNLLYVFYMGGIWERIIGIVCRIFNVIIMELKKLFIYDVLNIFMYEVCVIINS